MSGIYRIDQLAKEHYAGEFVQAIGFANVSTNFRGKNLAVEVPASMTVKTV